MAKKKAKKQTTTRRKTLSKKESRKTRGVSRAMAVLALILNLIILPGLGSLIAGKTKEGIWQMIISIVGIALSFVLIGMPIVLVAWIWGLITGIQLIQNSR
jgi:TM2 domain-containing membrane protein YozV